MSIPSLIMNNAHQTLLASDQFGRGNALVFLHGALLSSSSWQRQAAYFRKRYQVVLLDLPQHAASRAVEVQPYTVPNISKMVFQTLQALAIEKYHLCGHSLGGMVAQELALQYPERVLSLILAETSLGTRTSWLENMMSSLSLFSFNFITQKQLVKLSVSAYGHHPASRKFLQEEMSKFSMSETKKIMSAALNYSSRDRLSQVRVPTLILVGAKNRQTHRQAQIMQTLIADSRLQLVPDAYHLLQVDQPGVFNQLVEEFLDQQNQ